MKKQDTILTSGGCVWWKLRLLQIGQQVPFLPNGDPAPSQHLFSITLIPKQHWLNDNEKHTALLEAGAPSLSCTGASGYLLCVGLARVSGRWLACLPGGSCSAEWRNVTQIQSQRCPLMLASGSATMPLVSMPEQELHTALCMWGGSDITV